MENESILHKCTVRIKSSWGIEVEKLGTGFFVSPGYILSAAHNLNYRHLDDSTNYDYKSENFKIEISWFSSDKITHKNKQIPEIICFKYTKGSGLDFVLLKVNEDNFPNHPCVYLSTEEPELNSLLYTFGYSEDYPNGDSATFNFEGNVIDHLKTELYKTKNGKAIAGLSGAPLLDTKNQSVFGLITLTRHEDYGAYCVKMKSVFKHCPYLHNLNQHYHNHDRNWIAHFDEQNIRPNNLQLDKFSCSSEHYIKKIIHDFEHYNRDNENLIFNKMGILVDLFKLYIPLKAYIFQEHKTIDLYTFVKDWLKKCGADQLLILGDYGSGKTSFSGYLTYLLAKLKSEKKINKIPIFIQLKTYFNFCDLSSWLLETLKKYKIICDHPETLEYKIRNGDFIFILDGFDEMTNIKNISYYRENLQKIKTLFTSKSKAILTCRKHYFRDSNNVMQFVDYDNIFNIFVEETPHFKIVEIDDFNEEQILSFLKVFLDNDQEKISQYLNNIKKIYDLEDLAKRPILLAMIARTLPSLMNSTNPITVTELYKTYINIWLTRDEKRFDINYKNFTTEFIKELSWQMYIEDKQDIHYEKLKKPLKEYFNSDAEIEFNDHKIRTCSFLNRNELGYYKFIHKSFLEFFVALKIKDDLDNEKCESMCQKNLNKEIIQFIIELNPDENTLIKILKQSVYNDLRGSNAANILLNLDTEILKERNLSSLFLPFVNFQNANLSSTNFVNTHLENCTFSNTNLEQTDFRFSNLTNCIFNIIACECIHANISSNSKHLITIGLDKIVRLYDIAIPHKIKLIKWIPVDITDDVYKIRDIYFCKNQKYFYIEELENIKIYDINNGKNIKEIKREIEITITPKSFDSTPKSLIILDYIDDEEFNIIGTDKVLKVQYENYCYHIDFEDKITYLNLNRKLERIIVGINNSILICNIKCKILNKINIPNSIKISEAIFNDDGKYLNMKDSNNNYYLYSIDINDYVEISWMNEKKFDRMKIFTINFNNFIVITFDTILQIYSIEDNDITFKREYNNIDSQSIIDISCNENTIILIFRLYKIILLSVDGQFTEIKDEIKCNGTIIGFTEGLDEILIKSYKYEQYGPFFLEYSTNNQRLTSSSENIKSWMRHSFNIIECDGEKYEVKKQFSINEFEKKILPFNCIEDKEMLLSTYEKNDSLYKINYKKLSVDVQKKISLILKYIENKDNIPNDILIAYYEKKTEHIILKKHIIVYKDKKMGKRRYSITEDDKNFLLNVYKKLSNHKKRYKLKVEISYIEKKRILDFFNL